jgi:glycosyltransferase involved in cell wall biosynthesis
MALAKRPFFQELEFRMIGDGKLFDETLAPLRQFDNVKIERRFLTQQEIAQLHKEYGVFLVPTRMDTQGVSRDEAMSSGLVPVTNAVAAVPEFVDGSCGILAPPEDAKGLADGIEALYQNPAYFETLSIGAANRVRRQSDIKLLISKELAL